MKGNPLLRVTAILLLMAGLAVAQPEPTPTPLLGVSATATPESTPTPQVSQTWWVSLNNKRLFSLVALGEMTAEQRTSDLNSKLEKAVADGNWEVTKERSPLGWNLACSGTQLLTVTAIDAQAERADLEALAEIWRVELEQALRSEEQTHGEGNPGWSALEACLVAVILHFAIAGLARKFRRSPWPYWFYLWLGVSIYILDEFNLTRPLSNLLLDALFGPAVFAALAALIARIAHFVGKRALMSYFQDLERNCLSRGLPRWKQRLTMQLQVAEVFWGVIVGVGAFLLWARLLQIDLAGVIAGAGFFGVAFSLAAKDMLADWFAGINIVLEDQFGVGDEVVLRGTPGNLQGCVEAFSLRVTRLREPDGSIVTYPNSAIRCVSNLSAPLVNATLTVVLPARLKMREGMALVQSVVSQLASDWADQCAGEPRLETNRELNQTNSGQIKIAISTKLEHRDAVQAELAARLDEALREQPKVSSLLQ